MKRIEGHPMVLSAMRRSVAEMAVAGVVYVLGMVILGAVLPAPIFLNMLIIPLYYIHCSFIIDDFVRVLNQTYGIDIQR